MRPRYRQRRRQKHQRQEQDQLHERHRDSIKRERVILRDYRAEKTRRLNSQHRQVIKRSRLHEGREDRTRSSRLHPIPNPRTSPRNRKKNDDRRQQYPRHDICDAQDTHYFHLLGTCRRIKNHPERREQKQLINLQQRDEQNRAERAEETDSGLSMQVIRDAALSEVGVDQRQQVHARANRQDIPQPHRRIESIHDPGEAESIDREIKKRERHEDREKFEHRRLAERLANLCDRNPPENQRENRDGAKIRNQPLPERRHTSRGHFVTHRASDRIGCRLNAHASRVLTDALPTSTSSPR